MTKRPMSGHDAAEDARLGMGRAIPRQDIVDGSPVPTKGAAPPYPPAQTGMRGSGYPRAFRNGHALREGRLLDHLPPAQHLPEAYDLVVVGGGISGLSAAYFFRRKHGPDARILILDNHEDFGGHAQRNEFTTGADTRVANAGSFNIYSPHTDAQKIIFNDLGIDVEQLAETAVDPAFYHGMGMGQSVFFDKETFGHDRLLKDPAPWTDFKFLYSPDTPDDADARWRDFMRDAPLAEHVKQDIHRLYHEDRDYLAGLTPEEKIHKLTYMSYERYLIEIVGCDPMVCVYLRDRTFGSGRGLDAHTALAAHERFGLPGFRGLNLPPHAPRHPGKEYHFPEGNATIARLLVGRLIPGAFPARGVSDAITTRVRYDRLDLPANTVRLRLNATVINARNMADGQGVAVTYMVGDEVFRVTASSCVMACWFHIVPYLCPEMSDTQKEALHYNVHTPNLWVNVWLKNWKPFQKASTCLMNAPNSYYASIVLEPPVTVGGYTHSRSPDQPVVLSMLRGYVQPGLHIKDQFRMGRIEMYETTFETYERELRRQLDRALGPYGFNAADDILGITVNRWGHGYSYWYSPLYDDFMRTGAEPPHIRARQKFGRITIANTDSGGTDSTALAIDMAHRAIEELDG